jgi:hypothetical protein
VKKKAPVKKPGKKAAKQSATEKRKPGRPSIRSAELADKICMLLCEGLSLRSICLGEGMPDKVTVLRWLADDETFRTQYTRAREVQADVLAQEIIDIADDGTNDWIEKFSEDGKPIGYVFNVEAAQRSKLRVDARKWVASKLLPKKYGDRLQHANDPDNPMPQGASVILVPPKG